MGKVDALRWVDIAKLDDAEHRRASGHTITEIVAKTRHPAHNTLLIAQGP